MEVELLSNEALIHCHKDAVRLGLDPAFIDLLVNEMKKRNLDANHSTYSMNSIA